MRPDDTRPARRLRGNPWVVLVILSLGFFMTLLDVTIVNIAIPNMITHLHASLDDVLWVINGYTLILAVAIITAGRLGDLVGPRRIFAVGITLFTLGSVACALAANPGQLIAFRVVQGFGAAMLVPQTLAIIFRTFPPARRGTAFGVWGAVSGLALIAGPTLGGLLVTAFDWQSIFVINLPIGVLVLVATFLFIPAMPAGGQHRLDFPGVVLASAALFCVCYGLIEGQRYNWGTISGFLSIPLVIGVGVVLLVVFLLVQSRVQDREPLVPFGLFRERNFTLMNVVMGALNIAMMGLFLPFTIYLQSVVGMSALRAGLTMIPAMAVSAVLSPFTGRLVDRVGGRYLVPIGLTLLGIGLAWIALVARPTSRWFDFLPALLVAGVGLGSIFAPVTTVAMRDVNPKLAGAASGMLNMTRQVGSVLGAAVVGALLQNRLAAAFTDEATQRSTVLPPAIRPRFVLSFQGAAQSGLQTGGAQSGSTFQPDPGSPHSLVLLLQQVEHDVFGFGFVSAMRVTMAVTIAVIIVAALCALSTRAAKKTPKPALVPRTSSKV